MMTNYDPSHDSSKLTQYRSRKLAERLDGNVMALAKIDRETAVRAVVQAVADESYAAARTNGSTGEQARNAAQIAAQVSITEAVEAGLISRGWSDGLARSVASESWNNDDSE